jgi:leucyl aminopeptidase
MRFLAQKSTLRQTKSDAVAVFVLQNKRHFETQIQNLTKTLRLPIANIVKLERFAGKEGELVQLYTERKLAAPRLIIVGLGELEKLTLERMRCAAAAAAKKAEQLKAKSIAFNLPQIPSDGFRESVEDVAQAIVEGSVLSLYKFDKYLTEKKKKEGKLSYVSVFHPHRLVFQQIKSGVGMGRAVCEAVYHARDLENAPSNEIYPESLAAAARDAAAKYGFQTIVWDKKRIEREGFGGLLGVSSGSARPPVFIIMEYHGREDKVPPLVLIGKGITFDAGGISIKPSAGMAEMKMDMSGAAAVIGTMEVAARLKLPVNLVGLVPATENMPSGSALKPGDIVRHYGGKTSEVVDTDAEGRLILADALAYAAKYKPAAVVDLATLTGACVVALGHHATGMMGNDEELMGKLKRAGEKTYERVWQLPLFEEYEKQIKSDVADVKNLGGKWAGAITAALFLKKFVKDCKWVHLDIAGPAILDEDLPYTPKGGSGVGVRLVVELLRVWGA